MFKIPLFSPYLKAPASKPKCVALTMHICPRSNFHSTHSLSSRETLQLPAPITLPPPRQSCQGFLPTSDRICLLVPFPHEPTKHTRYQYYGLQLQKNNAPKFLYL